jgi:hypothetical protein
MNFSNEINLRIERVNKSIIEYRKLHNSIFNDSGSVITEVSVNLGLPYYIEHALTGKVLTMSNNATGTLTLENKPPVLNKNQEWNIINLDPTNTSMANTLYKISSNITVDHTKKCLSYDNSGSTYPTILNFANNTSVWKISNNNSYKTIQVGVNTTSVRVLDAADNKLVINNMSLGDTTRTMPIDSINTQAWVIMPSPFAFFKKRDDIYVEISEIKNLVKKTLPSKVTNEAAMDSNVLKINKTIVQLENAITELDRKTTEAYTNNPNYDPEILEGNYQHSTLYSNSKFYHYSAYILFSIFIIVSLIYIYINPTETSLDIFILALSLLILVYYIYDYVKRGKKIF